MLTQAQWQACKRVIVDRYATPSNLRGALQFLSVLAPIGGLWYAIHEVADDSPWLVAAATACLSLFLLRGFVLMHDCGHDSLFRSKALNRAGGFLLGVLAGMPQQVWAENHRYHHRTNGNWAKYRGPLNVVCVSDYLAMNDRERRRYRYTRDILMSPVAGCLYFLVNPRITWLRASYHLLRRRLGRAGRAATCCGTTWCCSRPGP
jgi:omega-6 fatty acid desaturase (delta-12 desaturase)